jgi:hypothetical protein
MMKKNFKYLLFIIPIVTIFLTGCELKFLQKNVYDADKTLTCSLTTDSGFESYGNIQYVTTAVFPKKDGINKNVSLAVNINFTKRQLTTSQLNQVKASMDTKFCQGIFVGAANCQSIVQGQSIAYTITGEMAQVYSPYGDGDNKLDSIKSYFETTEHMTCVVS